MPKIGERYQQAGLDKQMEWTGNAWMAVCPFDDVPVADDEGGAFGVCPSCRRPWSDIVKAAWPDRWT